MKKYDVLIFDADHTLLDYKKDELAALARTFAAFGVTVDESALEWCHTLSEETWTEAGLYDVESERIQREYHALYRSHVTGIFEKFFKRYPCAANPYAVGIRFLEELSFGGALMPNAETVLETLSKRYAVCIATNGLETIQRGRLKTLARFCDKIFISETLGAIKPTGAFFDGVMRALAVAPKRCLMIGDSLRSDVLGAAQAGMDSCWFNTRGEENGKEILPTYTVENLTELLRFL